MTLLRCCPHCGHELETRCLDGVDRRTCRQAGCGYVHWDNPVPVVAGLVLYEDGVLLARHRLWPADRFSLITGYLERHESPEPAVRRELREELGLETRAAQFIGHYPFQAKNQLIIAYALHAHGDVQLSDEIVETRLVPRGDLPHYDFGPFEITRTVVHDWLRVSTTTLMQQA